MRWGLRSRDGFEMTEKWKLLHRIGRIVLLEYVDDVDITSLRLKRYQLQFHHLGGRCSRTIEWSINRWDRMYYSRRLILDQLHRKARELRKGIAATAAAGVPVADQPHRPPCLPV